MIVATCSNCNSKLVIEENHYMEGHRDTEEVNCPRCNNFVTNVSTSGIPTVDVIDDAQAEELQKQIDETFGKGFNITK